MGRKRHTPEQIITALREAEVGLARGCDQGAGPAGQLRPSRCGYFGPAREDRRGLP